MAYTVTKTDSVFGNFRVAICDVTADGATGTVPTGFNKIIGYSIGIKSLTTSAMKFTTSGGNLVVSLATSGDEFFAVIYGN